MAFLGAYSDVLKTYSGIFLLDLPKVELHAIFFLFFFLPITRLYGNRVKKRHYKSLKRHYRLLKNATIGFNSILRKSSFKRGVFP